VISERLLDFFTTDQQRIDDALKTVPLTTVEEPAPIPLPPTPRPDEPAAAMLYDLAYVRGDHPLTPLLQALFNNNGDMSLETAPDFNRSAPLAHIVEVRGGRVVSPPIVKLYLD